ncbi:hypothetical protein ACJDU8_00530 [Clostridium sp. WILCCON 0269]|uniref:Uncharacterized protein n=1 Tax=Candidatus Clostridium eludens TaxID=3381663 RepID=A0ABW8SE71_9CLOT
MINKLLEQLRFYGIWQISMAVQTSKANITIESPTNHSIVPEKL